MSIKITQRNTIGAAHLGPGSGFAFRRGPLLAPEDHGGVSAGSVGGEIATTAPTSTTSATGTTTSAPATAPGGEGEKLLPQSQVNALIAQARREGREQRDREVQQTTTTPPTPKPAAAPKSEADRLSALEAELAQTRERAAFEKHAARLGLDDEVSDDLFALSQVQRPQNVGEWLAAKAARFATKPAPATSTHSAPTTTPTAPQATPPAAPPAAPAAPSTHALPTANGVVDLFNVTPAQLNELGPQGVRQNLEKLWAIGDRIKGAPERPKPPSQR